MKKFAAVVVLLLVLSGCSGEYADDGVEKISEMSEADHPEIAIGRDLLAAALRYDIDTFVERNKPKLKVCFLNILGEDPADELLARLEGTKLEVHKFSSWTTYFTNDQGSPTMPRNFLSISVRDVRVPDSTHGEVDTIWKASGIELPGETFFLERIEGTWLVINKKVTS
jgi:hypothetical protein